MPNDHNGAPFTRTGAMLAAWRDGLARADILWDLPAREDVTYAARLRKCDSPGAIVAPAQVREIISSAGSARCASSRTGAMWPSS